MKKLLLIDLGSIYYPAFHASGDEEVGKAFSITVETIAKMRRGYDLVAVCLDSPPYARRKALLPTYKAQRDAPTNVFVEQYRRTKERLEADGLLLLSCPGEESDDVIASAVKLAVADGLDVTVASADKDLLQLVDDANAVRVYSPMKDKFFARGDVIEAWHVPPEMLLDSLSLQGDSSDNVPGVTKVGPVTAAKLLMKFGTLEDVFANVDKITTPKLQEALFQGGPAARLAKQVIRLRDDCPIDWMKIYEERIPKAMSDVPEDADFDPISPAPEAPKSEPGQDAPPPAEVTQTVTTTALALVPVDFALELEPRTLDAAWKISGYLHNSRLYGKSFGTREAIFAVIIRGREMGITAATALDALSFFEGKVSVGAHILIDRAKNHPDCEYFQFEGGDDRYAEWTTKNRRNPKPTALRYTIEQAEAAGMLHVNPGKQPGNWHKRRAEMLRKTAGVQLARIEYPGALFNAYCQEELGE